MGSTVRLDRVSNGVQTQYSESPQFFARDIPVEEWQRKVVVNMERNHAILRRWMEEAYEAMSTPTGTPPPFPKELGDYDEEQKANARQKARAAQRVRGDSSDATGQSGSDV